MLNGEICRQERMYWPDRRIFVDSQTQKQTDDSNRLITSYNSHTGKSIEKLQAHGHICKDCQNPTQHQLYLNIL